MGPNGDGADNEGLFVIGCNARLVGKELKVAPRAELGDVQLDFVVCHPW